MKGFLRSLRAVLDPLLALAAIPAGIVLRFVRDFGVQNLPLTRGALFALGVFPIRRHYYEPWFHPADLSPAWPRRLAGIDWNEAGQLALLPQLDYSAETLALPTTSSDPLEYAYDNGTFEAGDAEFWYGMVRHFKPSRIIEIGSGHSTKLAAKALARNRAEDPAYRCDHICIEPYEMSWLERLGTVKVMRERVESLDPAFFAQLGPNDVLFIDSSHMIRPRGDVLFEYLEILPTLRPGVIVHIHDIFTPRDYRKDWIEEYHRFWNEQYLLEAFLVHNSAFRVLGSINYLKHDHPDAVTRVFPVLAKRMATSEPGSFYMQRI